MPARALLTVGLCATLLTSVVGVTGAVQDLTRAEADSMERKLAAIIGRAMLPAGTKVAPQRTSFTDREVNAFFKFNGQGNLPAGVTTMELWIPSPGRVEARAVVDLDIVRKSEPRSMLDPLNLLLRGTVEVKASGFFRAAQGMGALQLETATLAGISIPKSLLQQLVTFYTRSPELPDGFNMDKPFALPVNIREVLTQRGTATVIQ